MAFDDFVSYGSLGVLMKTNGMGLVSSAIIWSYQPMALWSGPSAELTTRAYQGRGEEATIAFEAAE